MRKYFLRRIGIFIITLWAIVTVTFILMKAIPGDPFSDEQALPQSIQEALREHYGLNDPLAKQYLRYLVSIFTWDFGPSLKYKQRTVNEIIAQGFPVSATLGSVAMAISIFGGIGLGFLSSLKSPLSKVLLTFFVIIGFSIPSFLLATALQYYLGVKWHLFPIARWGTWSSVVLPALSLAILPMAFIARFVRAKLLEEKRLDYISTARIKGLSLPKALFRHGLPNIIHPLFPYLAQMSANVLTGSFAIEKIFSIPGLGEWFIISIQNRDYPAIMGITVFYSAILLFLIFVADLLQFWFNPRLREAMA